MHCAWSADTSSRSRHAGLTSGHLRNLGSRTVQLCSLYFAVTIALSAPAFANAARAHQTLGVVKHAALPRIVVIGKDSAVAEATNMLTLQGGGHIAPNCSRAHMVVDSNSGPVKHQQIAATVQGVMGDPQQASAITIDSILQNEAPFGLHQYDKCPDAQINGPNSFSIRNEHGRAYQDMYIQQERRTYFISFTARNDAGLCNGVVPVCFTDESLDEACLLRPDDALYDSMSCSKYPFRRAKSLNWSPLQRATEFTV